jgi:uncharacterized membrane protein YsdA (DUF1294 family)
MLALLLIALIFSGMITTGIILYHKKVNKNFSIGKILLVSIFVLESIFLIVLVALLSQFLLGN